MPDAVTAALKVRENKLRGVLQRPGYRMEKSPRRDLRAPDFARFRIVRSDTPHVVAGDEDRPFSLTLPEIEAWIGGVRTSGAGQDRVTSLVRSTHPEPANAGTPHPTARPNAVVRAQVGGGAPSPTSRAAPGHGHMHD